MAPPPPVVEADFPASRHDGPNDDTKPVDANVRDDKHDDAARADANDTAAADADNTGVLDDGTNGTYATHDSEVHDAATTTEAPGTINAAAGTAISVVCRVWDGIFRGRGGTIRPRNWSQPKLLMHIAPI